MTRGENFIRAEVAHQVFRWFRYAEPASFSRALDAWISCGRFVQRARRGELAWESAFAAYASEAADPAILQEANIPRAFHATIRAHMREYREYRARRSEDAHHPVVDLSAEQRDAVLNITAHVRYPTPGAGRMTSDAPIMPDECEAEELIDVLMQHGVLSNLGARPDGCLILAVVPDVYQEWCDHITST